MPATEPLSFDRLCQLIAAAQPPTGRFPVRVTAEVTLPHAIGPSAVKQCEYIIVSHYAVAVFDEHGNPALNYNRRDLHIDEQAQRIVMDAEIRVDKSRFPAQVALTYRR